MCVLQLLLLYGSYNGANVLISLSPTGSTDKEPKEEIEKEIEEAAISIGVQTGIRGQRWVHQLNDIIM